MRYRHGRRAHGRLTIHLRQMAVHYIRVFGHQELTADREARVFRRFRDTGFLQQFQRGATGANKDKFGLDDLIDAAVFQAGDGHIPGVICIAFDATNFATQLEGEVVFAL